MDLLSAMKTEFAKAIAVYKTKLSQVNIPTGELKQKAEEIKKKKPNIGEKLEKAVDKAKDAGKKAIEDAMKEGSEYMESIKKDFAEIGLNVGELKTTTMQFPARVAMVPPSMIVATPMGPGCSTQLSFPLLQQLKAEGDALGTSYDKVASSFGKLGIDLPPGFTLPSGGSITIPGLDLLDTEKLYEQSADELKELINTGAKTLMAPILTPIGTVASVMVKLVGGSCGGSSGSMPEVESPMETPEYSAENCDNFVYIVPPENPELDPGDISAGNCSGFEAMQVETEFEYDEEGNIVLDENNQPVSHTKPVTPNCNNCKHYKQKS